MLATLNECLRMYPPVIIGLPRVVPGGGGTVAGKSVPEGTIVSVWQWAINHDPRFWTDPWEFRPERFLGEARYENDRLDAMQPFSTGPRNCIGKK
jgi:cytochrome P450